MKHGGRGEEEEMVGTALTGAVVDAGLKVHMALGPGLLESVYEVCLAHELEQRGLAVKRQVALPVSYRDVRLEAGFRLDLLVEDRVVVEVKAVERVVSLYQAQLMTYLRLSGLRVGFLMNFNVERFKDGLKRIAM